METHQKISNSPSLREQIWYFFPLQLLLLHLKRNQVVLLFWAILFLYITQAIGLKYGIPFLFLTPEYFDSIDFLSYFILGVATGGFIMAFNIYSYIMFASEFPFLATFSRPFIKFCYNNFIIPLLYVLLYCWFSYSFQINEELISSKDALMNLLGLNTGILFFIVFSSIYFIRFNKNIYHFSGKDEAYYQSQFQEIVKEATFHKKTKWYYRLSQKRKVKIVTYINNFKEIKLARNIEHYDKKLLKRVFAQNHINASIYELMLFITFLVLGFFRDNPLFNIPAGASIFIFFTLALLLYSALYSWFKGWTLSLFIVLLLCFNSLTGSADSFFFKSYAHGIDYSVQPQYTNEHLKAIATNSNQIQKDSLNTIQILENWQKNASNITGKKPKLVVLNISGGGLRSALWSFHATSYLDSICKHQLLPQTELITGASGGMIGISYLRALYHQKQSDTTIHLTAQKYKHQIAKDLLNPLLFGIATTDFIFRFQQTKFGDYSYSKDRGYSFEHKIQENFDNTFKNKTLGDYLIPEMNGEIPLVFLTPTIANDGRRLLISPHSHSYLATDTATFNNIDYQQLFKTNKPNQLKYLSALRMSANFPYVLPMVSLPSSPNLEIVDAGIKDNYGVQTSTEFLETFENWITQNTSGVIFIEIRDTPKLKPIKSAHNYNSLLQRLTLPVGNIVKNVLRIQDYNNAQLIQKLEQKYTAPLHCFTLFMNQNEKQNISMSWHLTQLDCENIYGSIESNHNQKTITAIKKLILNN
ncbi:MAG: patatin-like phospholipase family protein [Flavobacteriales bacterium]|jgi:hypothetical protein|nr:patatin-like phospholipase family protein [Flavobacteriales bacterium]